MKLCFMEIKSSQNVEITLSFTDIGKSCPSCDFLMSQMCLLTLLAKLKFWRKNPNLQEQLMSGLRDLLLKVFQKIFWQL